MTTHGKRHAKQDIMDAAWKLFTEQGYDETTIAQIIELSANSRSTFYHHFRGKDELLFSLAFSGCAGSSFFRKGKKEPRCRRLPVTELWQAQHL